jgi:SAM-dependent methyltransferase
MHMASPIVNRSESVALDNSGQPGFEEGKASRLPIERLCCPADLGILTQKTNGLVCESCLKTYPVRDGRPILIDELRSIFNPDEIANGEEEPHCTPESGWKYRLRKWFPANPGNRDRTFAIQELRVLLPPSPDVLVIGSGNTRKMYESVFPTGLVLTDITLKGAADLACDAHCLPFPNASFDLIIADQVLEHVLNPWAVASEITRCVKPNGIVYSGIPFYLPLHAQPYDFQRFSPAGHRMLYPQFDIVHLTRVGGPIGCLSLTLIGCAGSVSKQLWWTRLTSMLVRLLMKPFEFVDKRHQGKRYSTVPLATVFVGRKSDVSRTPAQLFAEVLPMM